jgi:hypothetical protein
VVSRGYVGTGLGKNTDFSVLRRLLIAAKFVLGKRSGGFDRSEKLKVSNISPINHLTMQNITIGVSLVIALIAIQKTNAQASRSTGLNSQSSTAPRAYPLTERTNRVGQQTNTPSQAVSDRVENRYTPGGERVQENNTTNPGSADANNTSIPSSPAFDAGYNSSKSGSRNSNSSVGEQRNNVPSKAVSNQNQKPYNR